MGFYYYKGICYERLDNWNLAEKNFLKSLKYLQNNIELSIIWLIVGWKEKIFHVQKNAANKQRTQ